MLNKLRSVWASLLMLMLLFAPEIAAAQRAIPPNISSRPAVQQITGSEILDVRAANGTPMATTIGDAFNDLAVSRGVLQSKARGIFVGDSRSWQTLTQTTARLDYKNAGFPSALRQLTKQRFNFDISDVLATSGFTTQQIIDTYLPSIVKSDAAFMTLLAGTNDWGAGITLAQSTANLDTIIKAALGSGKWVVLVAELPRGGVANYRLTTQQMAFHAGLHRWCQQQAGRANVVVIDAWPTWLADGTATDASALDVAAGLTFDLLHPSGMGAFRLAKLMQPIFETRLAPVNILPSSNLDQFSNDNPYGSYTPNPAMSGTGGNLVATSGTVTGTVPTNYRAECVNCAGLTAVLSVVTINGEKWWQAAISGTPTSASGFLEMRHGSFNSAANDNINAVAAYQVDAGQTGLNSVSLHLTEPLVGQFYADGGALDPSYNFTPDAVDAVLRTPTMVSTGANGGSANTQDSFRIGFIQNVAVSATVRMRALSVRRVR